MAKMTKAELEKRMAEIQAEYDAEDDEEMWVRLSNGSEVKLTGTRLKNYLRKHGLEEDEVEEPEVLPEDDEPEVKPVRKVTAKPAPPKSAPRKVVKVPEVISEELEDLEEDDPIVGKPERKSFF